MENSIVQTAVTKKIAVSIIINVLHHFLIIKLQILIKWFIVALAKSVNFLKSQPADTPHSAKYTNEGYVIFNEKGTVGKLCTENLNATLPETELDTVLQTTAGSLCSLLTYKWVWINFWDALRKKKPEKKKTFVKRRSSGVFSCLKSILKYPQDLLLSKNASAETHKSI